MAVPVWQSTTTATGTMGTISLSLPASTAVGDLLMAHFSCGGAVTATGWTSSFTSAANGFGTFNSMLYRVANGSEASPVVFTIAGSASGSGAMGRITGAHPTTPLDTTSTLSAWTANSATTVTAPSITTVTDQALVVSMFAWAGVTGGGSWSVTGPTEQYDFNGGIVMGATATKSPAGSVGTLVATHTTSGYLNGARAAIRPAPIPPTQPRVGMIGI